MAIAAGYNQCHHIMQLRIIGAGGVANGLALGDLPGVEQVELDFPHDVGDAGLAWFPGGEVAGFP